MKKAKQCLFVGLILLIAIAFLGCGVSKEEHEKTVADLNQAKGKIAEFETALKQAQAKPKAEVKAPAAEAKPAEAAEKPSAPADSGLEEKLAAAGKEAADLKEKLAGLTNENSSLKELIEKLKGQLAGLREKIPGIQTPAKELPTKEVPKELPKELPKGLPGK